MRVICSITHVHALGQVLFVRVDDRLDQAGQVDHFVRVDVGAVDGRHRVAAAVRRTRVARMGAPVALLIQVGPVHVHELEDRNL